MVVHSQRKISANDFAVLIAAMATMFFICGYIKEAHKTEAAALGSFKKQQAFLNHTDQYRPYVGILKKSEFPWVFDGKYVIQGKIIGVWGAGNARNEEACADVWASKHAYTSLCKHLDEEKIIAVSLDGIYGPNVAFIPVRRPCGFTAGSHVAVRTGKISPHGEVQMLPELLKLIDSAGSEERKSNFKRYAGFSF